jgi:hypothetical protein
MERYGGTLPNTLDELLALAGIGRYTAGAVACFAFDLQVATVDTNIRRVLWRLFRGVEPAVWPSGTRASREALALAEWALPRDCAYDWQQALMDLGATLCLSRRPLCERCPLTDCCAAYAETARVTLFPSGAALARLRDARAVSDSDGASPAPSSNTATDPPVGARHASHAAASARVAETPAAYDTAPDTPTPRNRVGARHASPGPAGAPTRRRKEPPFERSSRYYRGRAVEALRALANGESITLSALGPRVKDDYTPADLPWLRALLSGLARDGLARLTTDPDGAERIALPE